MAGKNLYYGGIYGAREWSINADTANTAIDLSQSNVYNISLSANTTVSFLNPTSTHYIFVIEQTVGSNTITWPDIKWKSGVPPTLSTTIGSKDTISIIYDGEEYYGFSTADYQTGFRLLDYYPDAAAAYSLRDLSQEWIGQPVVRVRRSSDNAERDFTSAEITDGTLLTWVNTEVVLYTSDFTSGNEDLVEAGGTGTDGESIGGVNDAYKFTLDASTGVHSVRKQVLTVTQNNKITFDIYIPSSNVALDGFQVRLINGVTILSVPGAITDTWLSYEINVVPPPGSPTFLFYALDGGIISVNGPGDVFYLKNIVVTQTTADGYVTTWYDQSGNSNNLSVSTASFQGKLVSSGSLQLLNSLPAIATDATDDIYNFDSPLSLTDMSLYITGAGSSNGDNLFARASSALDTLEYNSVANSIHLENFEGGPVMSFSSLTDSHWLFVLDRSSGSLNAYVNGTASTSNPAIWSSTFAPTKINNRTSSAGYTFQEIIVYDSSKSSDRVSIQNDINTYYSIY